MGTLPDLHIDVARGLVDQVTPRPVPERRRWPVIGFRMSVAALLGALVVGWFSPATAGPKFGPDWQNAIQALGISCLGDNPKVRICTHPDVPTHFTMKGTAHQTGDLYVSGGPRRSVIFVFDALEDAEAYGDLHPSVTRHGKAVVW